jgi:hypothetical protein
MSATAMSALCQKRTHAVQQINRDPSGLKSEIDESSSNFPRQAFLEYWQAFSVREGARECSIVNAQAKGLDLSASA